MLFLAGEILDLLESVELRVGWEGPGGSTIPVETFTVYLDGLVVNATTGDVRDRVVVVLDEPGLPQSAAGGNVTAVFVSRCGSRSGDPVAVAHVLPVRETVTSTLSQRSSLAMQTTVFVDVDGDYAAYFAVDVPFSAWFAFGPTTATTWWEAEDTDMLVVTPQQIGSLVDGGVKDMHLVSASRHVSYSFKEDQHRDITHAWVHRTNASTTAFLIRKLDTWDAVGDNPVKLVGETRFAYVVGRTDAFSDEWDGALQTQLVSVHPQACTRDLSCSGHGACAGVDELPCVCDTPYRGDDCSTCAQGFAWAADAGVGGFCEAGEAMVSITLAIDVTEVGVPGSDSYAWFEDSLKSDLAVAAGVSRRRFQLVRVEAGSVIATVRVSRAEQRHISTLAELAEPDVADVVDTLSFLIEQGPSPQNILYRGLVTSSTVASAGLSVVFSSPQQPSAAVEYDHSIELDSRLRLSWTVQNYADAGSDSSVDQRRIAIELSFQGLSWVAFAVSPTGTMLAPAGPIDFHGRPFDRSSPATLAVVGLPSTGEIAVRRLQSKHESGIVEQHEGDLGWLELTETHLGQSNGFTTMRFTRPLLSARKSDSLNLYGNTTIIWAYGDDRFVKGNQFPKKHIASGATTVGFTQPREVEGLAATKVLHGLLMWGAFGVAFPVGATFAVFFRHNEKYRIQIHGTVQLLGIGAAAWGAVLAWFMVEGHHFFHFWHALIGTVVLVVTAVQALTAVFRPHKPRVRRQRTKQTTGEEAAAKLVAEVNARVHGIPVEERKEPKPKLSRKEKHDLKVAKRAKRREEKAAAKAKRHADRRAEKLKAKRLAKQRAKLLMIEERRKAKAEEKANREAEHAKKASQSAKESAVCDDDAAVQATSSAAEPAAVPPASPAQPQVAQHVPESPTSQARRAADDAVGDVDASKAVTETPAEDGEVLCEKPRLDDSILTDATDGVETKETEDTSLLPGTPIDVSPPTPEKTTVQIDVGEAGESGGALATGAALSAEELEREAAKKARKAYKKRMKEESKRREAGTLRWDEELDEDWNVVKRSLGFRLKVCLGNAYGVMRVVLMLDDKALQRRRWYTCHRAAATGIFALSFVNMLLGLSIVQAHPLLYVAVVGILATVVILIAMSGKKSRALHEARLEKLRKAELEANRVDPFKVAKAITMATEAFTLMAALGKKKRTGQYQLEIDASANRIKRMLLANVRARRAARAASSAEQSEKAYAAADLQAPAGAGTPNAAPVRLAVGGNDNGESGAVDTSTEAKAAESKA